MIPTADLPRIKKAAVRILNSTLRKHVYETKRKDDENVWGPMLHIEQGFFEGAEKEWAELRQEFRFDTPEAASELEAILEEAFRQSRGHTENLLRGQVPNVGELLDELTIAGLNLIKTS